MICFSRTRAVRRQFSFRRNEICSTLVEKVCNCSSSAFLSTLFPLTIAKCLAAFLKSRSHLLFLLVRDFFSESKTLFVFGFASGYVAGSKFIRCIMPNDRKQHRFNYIQGNARVAGTLRLEVVFP